MTAKPAFTTKIVGERLHVIVTGEWTINASAELERAAREALAAAHRALKVTIDLDKVERIDTAGAWLVDRVRTDLLAHGIDAEFGVTRSEFALLLSEAKYQDFPTSPKSRAIFSPIFSPMSARRWRVSSAISCSVSPF